MSIGQLVNCSCATHKATENYPDFRRVMLHQWVRSHALLTLPPLSGGQNFQQINQLTKLTIYLEEFRSFLASPPSCFAILSVKILHSSKEDFAIK